MPLICALRCKNVRLKNVTASPTTPNGYYSYGRRDSVNRTRFLLVRTWCADGKQAFKRVTLPGGSTLVQLKKMIERSMRRGSVEAIMTLPDRVLVEEDSQIAQFSDCQKVEVIYGDDVTAPPLIPSSFFCN
ncbi:hypothetical protein ANCCAN_04783 [Ancylostoma caninum]|uniref:Ubiquitin-like domain-containing protein n=1 Tax=Ancylostoma caninum TaxID=29170 RepID=A0A368H1S6_ANCCA|nr:hypothetical protein ANCCAN_04783 [Ancylostoma caninum]